MLKMLNVEAGELEKEMFDQFSSQCGKSYCHGHTDLSLNVFEMFESVQSVTVK